VRAVCEVGSSVVHVVSSVPVRAVPWAGERAMGAGRWASSAGLLLLLLLSGGMLSPSPRANATGEAGGDEERLRKWTGAAGQKSQERQKAGATRWGGQVVVRVTESCRVVFLPCEERLGALGEEQERRLGPSENARPMWRAGEQESRRRGEGEQWATEQ
jgi:hypothetical protein